MFYIDDLKSIPIWVNYFIEERDGNLTKVPYDPKEFRHAKVNDPNTWGDYDKAFRNHEFNEAGIGFMFCELPDGLVLAGVDIDAHGVDHNPLTEDLLEMFEGTYAERSPSGDGVHIIFEVDFGALLEFMGGEWDKERFYMKNLKTQIECYVAGFTNRYFTFTENAINTNPVADMTNVFIRFLNKYMRKPSAQKVQAEKPSNIPPSAEQLPVSDILDKARKSKNGAKFSALYDRGDIGEYNNDDSSADLALCTMLAWWLQGDFIAIDEAFRRSALYRDKWRREDYRTATINKAITFCNGKFYSPSNDQSTKSASSISKDISKGKCEFILYNERGVPEGVLRAQLANHFRENEHFSFVEAIGDKPVCLYYNQQLGCYELINRNAVLFEIKKYVDAIDANLVKMCDIEEVFKLLVTDRNTVSSDDINCNQDIIVFRNGVLRLSTMEMLPHSPDYLSTVQIPCDYNPNAGDCPRFDAFIDQLSNGDDSVKQLLWEFLGLAVSNIFGHRTKKALYLLGAGNTGKSRYVEFVSRLLGMKNFASVDLKKLEERFRTFDIYGKRVAGCADMSATSVAELNVFKQLTGGDPIFFEGKGRDAFTGRFNGVLLFAANEMPEFGGDRGKHVYERMLIVPCVNSIPEEQWDNELVDKFWEEREAVIAKAITHLQQFIARGCKFDEPEVCRKARAKYRIENDPALAFLKTCTVPREQADHGLVTTRSQMYMAYCRYCDAGNFKKQNRQKFRNALFQNGVMDTRINNNRCYSIELTDDAREHLLSTF